MISLWARLVSFWNNQFIGHAAKVPQHVVRESPVQIDRVPIPLIAVKTGHYLRVLLAKCLGQPGIALQDHHSPPSMGGVFRSWGADGCKHPPAYQITLPLPFQFVVGDGTGHGQQIALQPGISVHVSSSLPFFFFFTIPRGLARAAVRRSSLSTWVYIWVVFRWSWPRTSCKVRTSTPF